MTREAARTSLLPPPRPGFRAQTEHDFNLEKQVLVHTAKLKIQEEYSQKERDREVRRARPARPLSPSLARG